MLERVMDKTINPSNVCWTDEVMIGTNDREIVLIKIVKKIFDDWRGKLIDS